VSAQGLVAIGGGSSGWNCHGAELSCGQGSGCPHQAPKLPCISLRNRTSPPRLT